MDRKNRPRVTRNSRHEKKKQIFSKKIAIASVIAISFILICGGVYATYAMQHKPKEASNVEEDNPYEQKEAALLNKIRESQKQKEFESTEQEKTDGNTQTLIYVPAPSDSIPQLPTIKTELTALIEAAQKNSSKNTKTKIVGYVKVHKINEQVISYQPTIETYTWAQEKEEWSEKTESGKNTAFVNQKTKQPLTLQDIFMSEANILAVQQVIQQKILTESPDGNAIIDGILNMPNITLDGTAFTYCSDKISLGLPENPTGKTEITLSYKDIAGYVNPEFVDPNSIKDALPAPLDPNKKYISLTFDDGPNPETTPRLLDILKEKGVKATFFMLGQNVVKHESLVKRVADEGHEVASHSYSHPQLTGVDAQRVKDEVQKTDKAIYRAISKLPTDFRPPYGAVNPEVARMIGKPIIQWSVDSQDWQSHNAEAIIKRIDETAYNDTIVLMHDIHPETVDAVSTVIDRLRGEGYEIIPSKDLLGKKAKPLHMYYGSKDERPIQ
ncbi:polysaccharide deacetylase family protein [Candidatus Enterococcus ikei]|uniref:Polysaccharide deacetylase family protein n=1 Tax=Candidatus Enterococcus ikei TaxID=2815326 RepID=A0ABS3H486_9ENTE|nr:polysaccharide deacetylase family protein [Enterococcus sp. DIV0869a]MBO0441816.1 polysaccharide deacetylase family protein [Enterococcus sp. DIV0869a]